MEFNTTKILEWAFALVVGALGGLVFLYGNFETKAMADHRERSIESRLQSIEEKQDKLLDQQIDLMKYIRNH